MINIALEILNLLNDNGYKAYIIGGAVRDYIMNIESTDIDITTNATPKQLAVIFKDNISYTDYGSVKIKYKNIKVEITTFRKEIKYLDNRHPEEIFYINSLEEDLKRRDITINTICMDKNKNIIDLLNGRKEIRSKTIKIVGDSNQKLENDSLRILRCIRIATKLNFKLDRNCVNAIKKNMHLLKKLSYERKKEELDKIFSSKNINYGIKLIKKLNLDKYLELNNIKKVIPMNDLVGMWAQFDVLDVYPLTKNISEQIQNLEKLKDKNLNDPYIIYKYGSYLCSIAGKIKHMNINKIYSIFEKLPIYNRADLEINGDDIIKILDKEPDKWVNEVIKDVEKKIIYKELDNDYTKIKEYILNKYKN